MAEVFKGTPAIVTVAVSDQEGRKVEYNVAGRDLEVVKAAVLLALEAIPSEDAEPSKPKAKRKRRTKSEMAASNGDVPEREKVGAGHGKTWAE